MNLLFVKEAGARSRLALGGSAIIASRAQAGIVLHHSIRRLQRFDAHSLRAEGVLHRAPLGIQPGEISPLAARFEMDLAVNMTDLKIKFGMGVRPENDPEFAGLRAAQELHLIANCVHQVHGMSVDRGWAREWRGFHLQVGKESVRLDGQFVRDKIREKIRIAGGGARSGDWREGTFNKKGCVRRH